MKKTYKFVALILGLSLLATGCYKEEIAELHNQIDNFADTRVKPVEDQVAIIQTVIESLKSTDGNIDAAIQQLKEQKAIFDKAIEETNLKVQALENQTSGDSVLSLLNEFKNQINDKSQQMDNAIKALEEKDFEGRVKALEEFKTQISGDVEGISQSLNEFKKTVDLAGKLQGDVNTINNTLTSINNTLTTVNSTLTNLDTKIDNKVSEITIAYNTAIGNATDDIKDIIKNSVDTVSTNIRAWVADNFDLSGYATIARLEEEVRLLKLSDTSLYNASVKYSIDSLNNAISKVKNELEYSIGQAIYEEDNKIYASIDTLYNNTIASLIYSVSSINTTIDKIGTETLLTSSQTLSGAINELLGYIQAIQVVDHHDSVAIATLISAVDALKIVDTTVKGMGWTSDITLKSLYDAINGLKATVQSDTAALTSAINSINTQIAGLALKTDLEAYLKSADAATTYQTITAFNAFVAKMKTDSTGFAQKIAALYTKTEIDAKLADYLKSADAATIYQTIAGMSEFAKNSRIDSLGQIIGTNDNNGTIFSRLIQVETTIGTQALSGFTATTVKAALNELKSQFDGAIDTLVGQTTIASIISNYEKADQAIIDAILGKSNGTTSEISALNLSQLKSTVENVFLGSKKGLQNVVDSLNTALNSLGSKLNVIGDVTTLKKLNNTSETYSDLVTAINDIITNINSSSFWQALFNSFGGFWQTVLQVNEIKASCITFNYIPEYSDGNATLPDNGDLVLKYRVSSQFNISGFDKNQFRVAFSEVKTRAAGDVTIKSVKSVSYDNHILTVKVSRNDVPSNNCSVSLLYGKTSDNVFSEWYSTPFVFINKDTIHFDFNNLPIDLTYSNGVFTAKKGRDKIYKINIVVPEGYDKSKLYLEHPNDNLNLDGSINTDPKAEFSFKVQDRYSGETSKTYKVHYPGEDGPVLFEFKIKIVD